MTDDEARIQRAIVDFPPDEDRRWENGTLGVTVRRDPVRGMEVILAFRGPGGISLIPLTPAQAYGLATNLADAGEEADRWQS